MTSNDIIPARIDISVVVPVLDEEGAVAGLAREIAAAFDGQAYEMIFVDDASRDATRDRLNGLREELPRLRLLVHSRNAGQSRALRSAILAARGAVVVTLDGDGQNIPSDAPRLARRLIGAEPRVGMVGGRRIGRRDSTAKRWGSLFANALRRRVLADGAEDTGCGLKAMRRDAYLKLPYFDHMHRFFPALMIREGYAVVFEDVGHRPRTTGRSKYSNLGRLIASLFDLAGVVWLRARMRDVGPVDEV